MLLRPLTCVLTLVLLRCTLAADVAIWIDPSLQNSEPVRLTRQFLTEGAKIDARIGPVTGDHGSPTVFAMISPADAGVRLRVISLKDGLIRHEGLIAPEAVANRTALALASTIEQVNKTRDQAPTVAVAVLPFISKDLTREQDDLRVGFRDQVVQQLLAAQPRAAVVAIEEAAQIDQSSHAEQRRFGEVACFVEGSFKTSVTGGQTQITLQLRVRDADRVLLDHTSGSIPLERAAAHISEVCTHRIVPLLSPGATKPIDPEKQSEWLIAAATEVQEAGGVAHAIQLREAAILRAPKNVQNRAEVVRLYAKLNQSPLLESKPPQGFSATPRDPFWAAIVMRTIATWHRGLDHCEYLVRNRLISREEATSLCHDSIMSITGVRATTSEMLGECETRKKKFIRESFVLVPSLEPADRETRRRLSGIRDASGSILAVAKFRCDGNFLTHEDLDLLAELVTEKLPDKQPDYQFMFLVQSLVSRRDGPGEDQRRPDVKQVDAFLDRLLRSERALPRIYARHARLYQRSVIDREPATREMLAEASSVVEDANKVGFEPREYRYFMGQLQDQVARIKRQLDPPPPRQAARVPAEKPEVPPSRISLEVIDLPELQRTWRAPGGNAGLIDYRVFGRKTEVFWSYAAVLMPDDKGQVREVMSKDERLSVSDVISDGKYVYVAACYGRGIHVLDRSGKSLALIDEGVGLPPTGRFGPVMLPIQEGKILVAGTIGEGTRGWIATVDFDGVDGVVKVIHEAKKPLPADNKPSNHLDPEIAFTPEMIVPHTTKKGRRLAYIPRRSVPLVIDLETLKVTAYPAESVFKDSFPRRDPPASAFLDVDGEMWVAGSTGRIQRFALDEATGLFSSQGKVKDWHYGNARSGSLMRIGDWVYSSGDYVWLRVNVKTGEEQTLVSSPRSLPDYGDGQPFIIQRSEHFGVTARKGNKLYRIRLDGEAMD